MPKKRSAVKPMKKAAPKKVAERKTTPKKVVGKQAPKAVAKKAKKKSAPKLAAPKPPAPMVKKAVSASPPSAVREKPEVSLGRPLVTQEEKLYMLFHEDFLARQVFEFLRVETVKELEQFSQQQIIHMMTKPLRTTVDRIRQRLAQFKRSLKDDEQFAAEFRKLSEER